MFNLDFYVKRCYACSHNTLLDGEDDGNCLADDHEHHQDEGRAQRFVFDKMRFILNGGNLSNIEIKMSRRVSVMFNHLN